MKPCKNFIDQGLLFLVLISFMAVMLALPVNSMAAEHTTENADQQTLPAIDRGAYLVAIIGCNDCHTPMKPGPGGPEPDMSRMLSGHPDSLPALSMPALAEPWPWAGTASNTAFAGPWGISYAFNLTPDELTGMGQWTEQNFIAALKTGRHMGEGRPIAPPMPWHAYRHMTDEDLKAIFAYLQSIPPIYNVVPAYMSPVPSAADRSD